MQSSQPLTMHLPLVSMIFCMVSTMTTASSRLKKEGERPSRLSTPVTEWNTTGKPEWRKTKALRHWKTEVSG